MKFRTEIEILPYDRQLSYDDRLLALGSCFATEIGRRMAEAKFRIAVNPSGVLFNPLSIVRTLRRYRDGRPVAKEELQHADGRWFHYDFGTEFHRAKIRSSAIKKEKLRVKKSDLDRKSVV